MNSDTALMSKGMQILSDAMGIVDAERFISLINREQFDYTEWQREYFDQKTPEELDQEIAEYCKNNPYEGNAKSV